MPSRWQVDLSQECGDQHGEEDTTEHGKDRQRDPMRSRPSVKLSRSRVHLGSPSETSANSVATLVRECSVALDLVMAACRRNEADEPATLTGRQILVHGQANAVVRIDGDVSAYPASRAPSRPRRDVGLFHRTGSPRCRRSRLPSSACHGDGSEDMCCRLPRYSPPTASWAQRKGAR